MSAAHAAKPAATCRLKVLTGRHASASADLPASIATLGRGEGCDVVLSDWSGPDIAIGMAADGLRGQWLARPQATSRWSLGQVGGRFVPWRASAFGHIVVAVGPADAIWPSDESLLAGQGPAWPDGVGDRPGARVHRRAAQGVLCVGALATMVLLTTAVRGRASMPLAATPVPPSAELVRLLEHWQAEGMTYRIDGRVVVLGGLLPDLAQGQALAREIEHLGDGLAVQHRYVVAPVAAATLAEVCAHPVKITYTGGTTFQVEGTTPDPTATRERIAQAAADMGLGHLQFAYSLRAPESAASAPAGVQLKSRQLNYHQLPNGDRLIEIRR